MLERKDDSINVNLFYILDLDRCLVDTNRLHNLLQTIIERETSIDEGALNEEKVAVEATGGSFDTASYIKQLFNKRGENGEELWNRMAELAIREAQAVDLLLPYVSDLFSILRERHAHFGIVTYGGAAWQETKVKASGLTDVPYIVTSIKHKGTLLESWQKEDGSFILPAALGGGRIVQARSLVFIDDKPISFEGLPDGVKGICTISPGVTWPNEVLATLPSHVKVVNGLGEAIKLLFSH